MKLYDIVFCDDIRHEMNNKLSLMGVYNDKIIFNIKNKMAISAQLSIKLALLLRFKLEEKDLYPESFEFIYSMNGKNTTKISGEVNQDLDQKILVLALINHTPLETGDLGFSIKLFKKDEIVFQKKEAHGIKILIN